MENFSIPIIIIICYLFGEIYKAIIKNNEELKKIIPIIVTLLGGLIGIIMYKTNSEIINYADDVWVALEIGMISGATSTNTNQIIKQIFKGKEDEK